MRPKTNLVAVAPLPPPDTQPKIPSAVITEKFAVEKDVKNENEAGRASNADSNERGSHELHNCYSM